MNPDTIIINLGIHQYVILVNHLTNCLCPYCSDCIQLTGNVHIITVTVSENIQEFIARVVATIYMQNISF